MSGLLVVAGEASGDRAASAVVARLPGARVFGLGGAALAGCGVELVGDLRSTTALGIGEALARGWSVVRAWHAVVTASEERRPRAALLVNYSEFNTRLARRLHAAAIPVLWYGAPQVWAWRPTRAAALRRFVDRMAVILPFEERIWREAGVDALYVGHPALETPALSREEARRVLDIAVRAPALAILPGSRPHEVRSLLDPMLDAFARLRSGRPALDGRVLVAASLDERTKSFVRDRARWQRVRTFDVDARGGAAPLLRAFDVALCASGTVSLEAALAHAVPVVVYRVGPTTEMVARLALRTPHVGLPNVLLGRRAFTELLQREARPDRMADAVAAAIDHRESLLGACEEIVSVLGHVRGPSASVARLLAPWLGLSPEAA
ncbi:MAG TPA: lipid-A-disaccharide synthase [Polyangiaceae bacterium]|nr:lipid-A-disaccharide synthase [Polyangiaceae bacterium]